MASETRNIVHIDYFYDVFFLSVISFHTVKLLSLYGREQLEQSDKLLYLCVTEEQKPYKFGMA